MSTPRKPQDRKPPRAARKGPKIKLVKVLVQPVFVLDHGDHLSEIDHPTTAIPADEWPSYSSERFPREVAEWQKRLDQGEDG